MTESFIPTMKIPKGKKVLDFLQELDGDNEQLQTAWIFLHSDVINALREQLAEPSYEGEQLTLYLFHEVEDRHVGEITFDLQPIRSWHLVRQIYFHDDCPYRFSYSVESIDLPTAVLLLVM